MHITSIADFHSAPPAKYLERDLHSKLVESLSQPEVTVLHGPRQVGKSVEIGQCIRHLLEQEQASDIFYYNLDNVPAEFGNPDQFLNLILSQKAQPDSPTYVFIDEAQRLGNIGLFVKYLHDQGRGLKFFLSGSASLDIKEKIKEPLTGRKREFFLAPLSLGELLAARGFAKQKIQGNFPQLQEVLAEYMRFGGYPGVVTRVGSDAKKAYLEEVTESYLLRDLANLFDIAVPDHVRTVAIFLAEQIGNMFSKENVSQASGISKYETEKIIYALEKLFVIWFARPYSKHRGKELIHRPKAYFLDPGIRNALLRKLDPEYLLADTGKLFENAIGNQLVCQHGFPYVHFWRTINQTEVDFVVEKPGGRLDAWECKFGQTADASEPKSLGSFRQLYAETLEKSGIVTSGNYWQILE